MLFSSQQMRAYHQPGLKRPQGVVHEEEKYVKYEQYREKYVRKSDKIRPRFAAPQAHGAAGKNALTSGSLSSRY